MTMTAEAARAKLRGGVRTMTRPIRMKWDPPDLTDFAANVRVLCWDPALLHTGWVSFTCRMGNSALFIDVHGHATINQKNDEKGYLGTLKMAEHLNEEIRQVFRRSYDGNRLTFVLIEAPAVGGHRTESSLIAGLQVWQQPECWRKPNYRRLVSVERISKILCGNTRHDKKEVTEALLRYIPDCTKRGWSQHQRDAAAVGLAFLYDLKHQEEG